LLVCFDCGSRFYDCVGGSSAGRGDFEATCAASSNAKVSRAGGISEMMESAVNSPNLILTYTPAGRCGPGCC